MRRRTGPGGADDGKTPGRLRSIGAIPSAPRSALFALACLALLAVASLTVSAGAQRGAPPPPGGAAAIRLAIVAAEDRRAPAAGDLARIRSGARSADAQTARIAARALGRLERPELIGDILPLLKHALPEVRAEAANAIGQAAQGWIRQPPSAAPRTGLESAAAALAARLTVEADPNVRAVIGETIGRLPYATAGEVVQAEQALLGLMGRNQTAADRLGVARGLEAVVRLHRTLSPPDADLIAALQALASVPGAGGSVALTARGSGQPAGRAADPARDARVRRLAMTALIDAEAVDEVVLRRAAGDPDVQMRRLAMRAAAGPRIGAATFAAEVVRRGLADAAPIVRVEALRAVRTISGRTPDGLLNGCAAAISATGDGDSHVAMTALDQLAVCPSDEAVSLLERTAGDLARAAAPRGWHRAAHAIVALAAASPPRGAACLRPLADSSIWQLRMYAARAGAIVKDAGALERLAHDEDDNVREAAIDGLAAVSGHAADALYVEALATGRYQVLRAAATALAGTAARDAIPALTAALNRLVLEGRDNSHDARTAIAGTLRGLGAPVEAAPRRPPIAGAEMTAAELRLVAAARARVTIRGVGRFELALIGSEAPATAVRFARLAQAGYYNGLTFHRVAPNFVVQGGSPGANEYIGDASFMRDEVGRWPHVRGAVGISTRGRDTGDAQIFIDLVDNPRLDHEYTVFAQVLNGMDIVDAILEGDIIEKVEILGSPG
ncbi:MAG: peptidylprolyl isomerase [Acidobacteriota bacterium]